MATIALMGRRDGPPPAENPIPLPNAPRLPRPMDGRQPTGDRHQDAGGSARRDHVQASSPPVADELAAAIRARHLNALLKGRREELQLSQEDVAEKLQVSARAYGNWERGRVKKWTDHKLYTLSTVLKMTGLQQRRLFLLTVDREPQPHRESLSGPPTPENAQTKTYLRDYATMINAVTFPSFLVDHRWNVKLTNPAFRDLFRDARSHTTAMPDQNFLRFVIFHPDAPTVLADHSRSWLLPMLAQLSSALEIYDQDHVLHAIRRDIARDPAIHHAYLHDTPKWLNAVGCDETVRPLHHPDRLGLTHCRMVGETPRTLQARGFTHITMVLTTAGGLKRTREA
ncbi:MmyB family transcriptional regulator [Streptomyces sp. 7N604]|uniref:MmyB family transcriptional regulator n=1 Tax=Streptomyces sp. 7N604 TaxID=3457415 RepID=UPI003FD57191